MTNENLVSQFIEVAWRNAIGSHWTAYDFTQKLRKLDAGKGDAEQRWRAACKAVGVNPTDRTQESLSANLAAIRNAPDLKLSRGEHNPLLADAERRARAARGDDSVDTPFDGRTPEEAIALSQNPVLKDAVARRDPSGAGNVVLADAKRRAEGGAS